MVKQYADVIRDDLYRLLRKRGRASDSDYRLIMIDKYDFKEVITK